MVTIDILFPILIEKFEEYMVNSFIYTTQEEAQTTRWNPDTGKVESGADQYMVFAMEGDIEFEFLSRKITVAMGKIMDQIQEKEI